MSRTDDGGFSVAVPPNAAGFVAVDGEAPVALLDAHRLMSGERISAELGEIGAGHTVTALYELVPPKSTEALGRDVDELRYQKTVWVNETTNSDELYTLKLCYKPADGKSSTLMVYRMPDTVRPIDKSSLDFRFQAAVAGLGMLLRRDAHAGNLSFNRVLSLGESGLGEDRNGRRAEFMDLVRTASALPVETAMLVRWSVKIHGRSISPLIPSSSSSRSPTHALRHLRRGSSIPLHQTDAALSAARAHGSETRLYLSSPPRRHPAWWIILVIARARKPFKIMR